MRLEGFAAEESGHRAKAQGDPKEWQFRLLDRLLSPRHSKNKITRSSSGWRRKKRVKTGWAVKTDKLREQDWSSDGGRRAGMDDEQRG